MIRIVIENVFLFLLPTLLYVTWVAFEKNHWPGLWAVVRQAPLVKLFAAGTVLMLTTLALFSSREGNKPGDAYRPQIFKDGQIERGQRESAPTQPSIPAPTQPQSQQKSPELAPGGPKPAGP